MMKRKHPLIAFFGIDGSGKTTLIKELEKKFAAQKKRTEVMYMGLGNVHYFKPLKWIMGLRAKKRKKFLTTQTKARKFNYRQRGFFWVLGQYCELWLRFLHAKLMSRKKIILFDRYFYDGLVLGSERTFHFFKYLTPKPTKSFLVTASPKLIRSRKDEASEKDIKKFYKKASLLSSHFDIIKIDNSKPLNQVVNSLLSHIKSTR